MNRYFLDESGHSGDLISAPDLEFSGQPIFALACVGGDEARLATELERLRVKHGCGAGELKSKALGPKLPAFASDLIQWLRASRAPIFVELVEKRFFLVNHIVNHLLCGPYDLDDVAQGERCAMAEFLHCPDFDAVLLAYLSCCRSQSLDDVVAVIDLLWASLDRSDEDVARDAQLLTMYARDRVREKTAEAVHFLPIADTSLTGKKVWMLPNLQSLTNIYGRINMSRRDLEGVTLVHDVQLQYGSILEDAKSLLEVLAAKGAMPAVRFSNYSINGSAELRFAAAEEEPCLQAADIIAGCAMRFARAGVQERGRGALPLRQAFFELLTLTDPFRAIGTNLVMSDRLLDKLGVPHF